MRLLQHFATPFLEDLVFGPVAIAVGIVLYLLLFGLGTRDTIRRRPETWPIFAYPAAYFIAFAAANPLIFRWYLAPPLPMFFLAIFLGIVRLSAGPPPARPGLGLRRGGRRPDAQWMEPAAAGRSARPAPEMAFVGLEQLYTDIGQRLQRHRGAG